MTKKILPMVRKYKLQTALYCIAVAHTLWILVEYGATERSFVSKLGIVIYLLPTAKHSSKPSKFNFRSINITSFINIFIIHT